MSYLCVLGWGGRECVGCMECGLPYGAGRADAPLLAEDSGEAPDGEDEEDFLEGEG